MASFEDFERAISELEGQIEKLKRLTREQNIDRSADIAELEAQVQRLLTDFYTRPSGWMRTRIARNPKRPFTLDFIRMVFQEFQELHGDRCFGDDGAMVGGLARLNEDWVVVVGQQKGRDAQERHRRNFGMARPEGYRKALRLMKLAEKFHRPIICFIDTPAADCTVPSEERGISEAIAHNLQEMFLLRVPIIVVILGEGGSGGAIGIGVGDRVLMFEHAIYSVIPPEGCAAIIWKDAKRGEEAAEALQLTAEDAVRFGAVDEIVPEPLGGAHRDPDAAGRELRAALERHLAELTSLASDTLTGTRYARFRRLGEFVELSTGTAAS